MKFWKRKKETKVAKVATMQGPWHERGSKGQVKGGKGESRACWTCGETEHIAAWCRKGGNKILYAIDQDYSENVEETLDNDEELQAWCLSAESVNEHWQQVISRRDKRKVKKANQASSLSLENSQHSNSKKIIEVKDRWVQVRVIMDSGVAGHVMLEGMFPRVRFEHKTSPKRFVAANVEQIRDSGEKLFQSRPMREF